MMPNMQANRSGQWAPAIPLPMFLPLHRCECQHPGRAWAVCGRTFWTMSGYRGHYALVHILELSE